MNQFKEKIVELNSVTHFNKANIEKSLRLLNILNYIFVDSKFKNALVLKGGTALNLVYLNLNRLSVDIDLDYVGSLDKNIATNDKINLINNIKQHLFKQDYLFVDKKYRQSAITTTLYFSYMNISGGLDNIKIDINTIDRTHIMPLNKTKVSCLGQEVNLCVPSQEEIFGMKICAAIARAKPRDLYDAFEIFKAITGKNKTLVRKMTIFYLSLDKIFQINDEVFRRIKSLKYKKMLNDLVPVLKSNKQFIKLSQDDIVQKIKQLLVLTNRENEYLIEFEKGNYNPALLFDDKSMINNAKQHPMAGWIVKQKQKV